MQRSELYIGMMSGTSLDGIDAVLVDFGEPALAPLNLGLKTLARATIAIPQSLREELLDLHVPGYNELHRAQCASLDLGWLYVQAIEQCLLQVPHIPRSSIEAVGIHGQTIRHCPEAGYTLQLNAPALVAEYTQLNIVSDFRSADIAAGGQGAPLVPAFHAALLGCKPSSPAVVLNLGGISNISVLKTDAVRGWDCGPANMLLDAWCQRHTGSTLDDEGKWAQTGTCLEPLLKACLEDPYFSLLPPKSTGRDYFNLEWLDTLCVEHAPDANPADIQATLVMLTAESIAQDIAKISPHAIWVGGGGIYNTALIKQLQFSLQQKGCFAPLESIANLGIAPSDFEAIAFAWLARQHMLGLPGNEPLVTGAKGKRALGSLVRYQLC